MILVTQTFHKSLRKLGSVSFEDIKKEILKHNTGLSNFVTVGTIDSKVVLKGYLNSKKVRIVILFQTSGNGKYFPFYIARKESKHGYNISQQSISFLEQELQKHYRDLETGNFEKIQLQ